jgi:hypothetical protein
MDIKDTYRAFYPAAAQYTCFSVARGTFSKKKASFKKYIKFEIAL